MKVKQIHVTAGALTVICVHYKKLRNNFGIMKEMSHLNEVAGRRSPGIMLWRFKRRWFIEHLFDQFKRFFS